MYLQGTMEMQTQRTDLWTQGYRRGWDKLRVILKQIRYQMENR